jgi:hypothetical protein
MTEKMPNESGRLIINEDFEATPTEKHQSPFKNKY